MFLRANKRFKDGKEHRYWSVVENRRVAGGRTVQQTLLYLGEINDSDRASWTRAIEAVDERDETRQIHLIPEDRTPDPLLKHPILKLRLDQIELARPRQWASCWLALELWNRLDLDAFWQPLLPDSQKGTPWLKVLKTLTAYRLLDPGSEWKLHRSWFDSSAMADLLDDDFRLAAKDTLYRCHDRLLDHREALFSHLRIAGPGSSARVMISFSKISPAPTSKSMPTVRSPKPAASKPLVTVATSGPTAYRSSSPSSSPLTACPSVTKSCAATPPTKPPWPPCWRKSPPATARSGASESWTGVFQPKKPSIKYAEPTLPCATSSAPQKAA